MAQPVEIPLSRVLDLPKVKRLRMSQLGGFVLLARAYLLDGFDPFTASQNDCMIHARANNPQSWKKCKLDIFAALEDALPKLKQHYERNLQKKQNTIDHGRRVMLMRHANMPKIQKEKPIAQSFLPETAHSVLSQPQKAQRYRPEDTDYMQRAEVKASRKELSGKPLNRLVD